MAKKIRVMVVDDHYVVRMGLAAILHPEPDMEVVAEAEDGFQALEMFLQSQPDITLMDLRMPHLSGVEATRAIRKQFPAARILMLTTYDGDEDIYRALEAGAQGYLLKSTLGEELIEAIHAVIAGQRYIPQAVTLRLTEREGYRTLTERELEVLRLVVKGLTNKEIAGVLHVTRHTAKAHVTSIIGKLGVADRTEAATQALQRGIVHLD